MEQITAETITQVLSVFVQLMKIYGSKCLVLLNDFCCDRLRLNHSSLSPACFVCYFAYAVHIGID